MALAVVAGASWAMGCSVYTPDLLQQGSEVSVDDTTPADDATTDTGGGDVDATDDATPADTAGSSTANTGGTSTGATGTSTGGEVPGSGGSDTSDDSGSGTDDGATPSTTGSSMGSGSAATPPGVGADDSAADDAVSSDDSADDTAADDGSATDDAADDDQPADDTTDDDSEEDDDSTAIDQDGPSEDPLIDDFEDGNTQIRTRGLREGYWFTSTDGMSDGTITDIDDVFVDLPDASGGAAHVIAEGFDLESPAAVFGVNLNDDDEEPYHQSAQYDGLAFFACSPAGAQRIVVEITTTETVSVYNHYRATVRLTDEWQQFAFEWDDFSQTWGEMVAFDPAEVVGIQFNLDADTDEDTLESYDLWLDDIEFIEGGSTSATGPSGACPGAVVDSPASGADAGAQ